MTNPGLPEGRRISLKAEQIVAIALVLRKASGKETKVFIFSPASQYQPQGLAKLPAIFGHINPMFLTGTAKAVYGCCAANALKPVIKRLSKDQRAIVISAK